MSSLYYFVCVIFGLPFLLFYLFFIIYFLKKCCNQCYRKRLIKNKLCNDELINYNGLLDSSML